MATYLPGSNIQSDAMQTLYLMNPSYTGYTDASNPNNMVLISPSVGVEQNSPLANSAQHQHQHRQFVSFPLPPGLAQSSLVQHSALTDTPASNIGQQNTTSVLFPNQVSNHIYSWTGGNELSFIPSNDVTHVSHHGSVHSGQQSAAPDISLYGLNHRSVSAVHDQQAPLLQTEVVLGLNVDNTQVSSGVGHGLSLSLSPQQPSAIQVPAYMQLAEPAMSNGAELSQVAEDNINRGDRFPNKWTRSLSSFRASSRDRFLGSSYQNATNDAGSIKQPLLEIGASMRVGPHGLFARSKYLEVAQLLLDEVVNVGRGFKSNSTKENSTKETKVQVWIEPTSNFDSSLPRERTLSENPVREGMSTGPVIVPSIPEHSNVLGITQAERQELQMKKAKLMGMLAEVDQRYRQYYNQMQIVMASFESAAGLGAAKTYTALALKTISRHFRSLRDAIGSQMLITTKALGEEEALPQLTRETSRLQFVDQQLRQNRTLQQLGMMQQQHAWRPQRGLPERSVSILRAWLFEHFLHPYPKDADKLVLARQAGLTRSQVSNWFINARVRLWKPMVEEMYLEETKEAGSEAAGAIAQKKIPDETESLSKSASARGSANHEVERQSKTEARKEDRSQEKQSVPDHTLEMLNGRTPSMNMTSCIPDGQVSRENSLRQEGVKKSRHSIQDSASLVSPNTSIDIDIKSEETRSGDACENDYKLSKEDSHSRDDYSISHNGLEGLGGFGSYQGTGGLNPRYCQEIPAAAARYSVNNSVSLTLGLQRCDGLPLSAAAQQQQQHYAYGQSLQPARGQDMGDETEEGYHYIHGSSSTGQINGGYESSSISFPSRKRFATQLLQQQQQHQHDFVA